MLDINKSKYVQKLMESKKQQKMPTDSQLGKDGKVLLNLEFYEEKAFAKTCLVSSQMEAYINEHKGAD